MYSLFFVLTLASLIALLRPVEHRHPHPGLLRACQLLKGGTIQLFTLQERMSQPVELIVVLTQHRLCHLIPVAEQALHLQIDHCRHARPAHFAGRRAHRGRQVLRCRRVTAIQQKPPCCIGDERSTVRGRRIAIVIA